MGVSLNNASTEIKALAYLVGNREENFMNL